MSQNLLTKKCFILFLYIFIVFALTLTGGQLTSVYNCDHHRLQRCQQDVTNNIQDLSNTQSGYSGQSNGYQSSSTDTHSRCSGIRQNLDCLLMYTPACLNRTTYSSGSYGTVGSYDTSRTNFGDFIRRAKQTLERYCEQGGGGWKSAACYMRQDIRDCESRYGFQSNPQLVSSSACRNYQDFRDCAVRIVRQSCYSQDLQLMATYLVDKAQDLSWSCSSGTDYNTNYNDRDRGYGYNRDRYDSNRDNDHNRYDRDRDRDRYGSGYDSNRDRYDTNRDRYNDPYRDRDRYPYDRDRGYGGYGSSSDCLENVGYYVRTCEDQLISRQRDVQRDGRDTNRRMCCTLYYYRDCVSQMVVSRCRDPSPGVVDILMGSRKRDLTTQCRDYSRDQCSHSSETKLSLIVLFLSVLIAIKSFKNHLF